MNLSRWIRAVLARLFHSAGIIRWLTALSLAVAFGTLGLGGAILLDLRTDAWRKSEQASDNLILALSRDIDRNILLYDHSIQGVMKAWAEPALVQSDPRIRQMALFGPASAPNYLGAMLVTNVQGDVVANSLSIDVRPYNMAYREHFTVHQQSPHAGLFISRPVDGRVARDKIIVLTRRLNNPDGSFGGVVSGSMRVAYFQDLFDKLDLGPNGSVTLFRSDGRIIMRRPYQAQDIDRDLGDTASFRTYLKLTNGHLLGTATLDGVQRFYTFHKIDDLPLYLSVALGVDDIYADWWRKATSIGAILAILCGASIGLSLLFRQEIKRRMAAERSLREAARELSVMAATDSMTGIPNRRSYEAALAKEWLRAIRGETSLAILMLDIDCFKLFNDRYGHAMGDDVVKAVAACVSQNLRRPADTAARYGGEEFVALLPDTELPGAMIVAEAIHSAVAALAIVHVDSPSGFVSVSIGVAVAWPRSDNDPAAVLKQADDALYEAKRSGRDRVVVGDGPAVPVSIPGASLLHRVGG